MMMLDWYKITNDSLTSLTAGGGQPIGASPFSFPGIVGPIIGDALNPISPLSEYIVHAFLLWFTDT